MDGDGAESVILVAEVIATLDGLANNAPSGLTLTLNLTLTPLEGGGWH